MKKRYIICFLSVATIAFLSYFISYNISKKSLQQQITSKTTGIISELNTTTKSNRISTTTTLTNEIYNINTGELTYTSNSMPIKYLECDKDEFIGKLSEEQQSDNVVKVELIAFSNDEVVVRTTIAYELQGEYYVKLEDDMVIIYHKDQKTIYDYTTINAQTLPEDVKKQLEKGIILKSDEELYEFLQNYSS